MKIYHPTLFGGKHTALLVAALALLGPGRLGAQTAVSNLGQGTTGSVGFIGTGSGYSTTERIWSFTTGTSGSSFDFTGITAAFLSGNGAPPPLTIGLYSAFDPTTSAGVTGSDLVASLSLASGNPMVAGNATFSGTANLLPSTTYFLLLNAGSPSAGNEYNIPFAGTINEDAGGLAGWSMLAGHWVNIGSFNGPGGSVEQWTLYPDVAQFSVQATASGSTVPEPSTYAVFAGLGVLGFAARRRAVSA